MNTMPGILHGEQFVYSPEIPAALESCLLEEAKLLYAEARAGHMIQQYYADQHYTAWVCDLKVEQQTDVRVEMPESSRALLMVLSGNATLHVKTQHLFLQELHYCLLPGEHGAKMLSVEPGSFRMVVLLFNSPLTALLGNVSDLAGVVHKGALSNNTRKLLADILQNKHKGEVWQFKRQLLFLDLLLSSLEEIHHIGHLAAHLLPHRDFEKLEQVKQYVRNNMGKKLSVQMLADRFEMLPTQLRRGYKQVYKQHLAAYIRNERLARAKVLLGQTDMPVHAIAWEVGYESAAGFTRIFTEVFQVSPTDYRKANRNGCN